MLVWGPESFASRFLSPILPTWPDWTTESQLVIPGDEVKELTVKDKRKEKRNRLVRKGQDWGEKQKEKGKVCQAR